MEEQAELTFEQEKQRLIRSLTERCTRHERPSAYLVVDSFGTASDVMPNVFMEKEHGDAILVSSGRFGKDMAQALLESMSKDGYNLVVESTLLDSDSFFWATNLRNPLEERGYSVSLNVLFVRPELSYLVLQKRAAPETHKISLRQHFADVKKVLKELLFLDALHFFTRLRLFTADGNCVYDETERGNSWAVMEDEFARELTPDEKDVLRREYASFVESSGELERLLIWFSQAFQRKAEEDAKEYFEEHRNDAVRREVEIPYWQDVFVQANGLDLSAVLRDAIDKMAKENGKEE